MSVGPDLEDRAGALGCAYALGPADAVLVRPDGYVAQRLPATATPRADLRAAVDGTLGRAGAAALELICSEDAS